MVARGPWGSPEHSPCPAEPLPGSILSPKDKGEVALSLPHSYSHSHSFLSVTFTGCLGPQTGTAAGPWGKQLWGWGERPGLSVQRDGPQCDPEGGSSAQLTASPAEGPRHSRCGPAPSARASSSPVPTLQGVVCSVTLEGWNAPQSPQP